MDESLKKGKIRYKVKFYRISGNSFKDLLGGYGGTTVNCLKKGKDKVKCKILPDVRQILGMNRISGIELVKFFLRYNNIIL